MAKAKESKSGSVTPTATSSGAGTTFPLANDADAFNSLSCFTLAEMSDEVCTCIMNWYKGAPIFMIGDGMRRISKIYKERSSWAVIRRMTEAAENVEDLPWDFMTDGKKVTDKAKEIEQYFEDAVEYVKFFMLMRFIWLHKKLKIYSDLMKDKEPLMKKLSKEKNPCVFIAMKIIINLLPRDPISGTKKPEVKPWFSLVQRTIPDWQASMMYLTDHFKRVSTDLQPIPFLAGTVADVEHGCAAFQVAMFAPSDEYKEFTTKLESDPFVFLDASQAEMEGNLKLGADSQRAYDAQKEAPILFDDAYMADEMDELKEMLKSFDITTDIDPNDFASFGLMNAEIYYERFMNLTKPLNSTERFMIVALAVAVTSQPRILKAMEVFKDKAKDTWYPKVHEWFSKIAVQYTNQVSDPTKSFAVVHIPSCNPSISACAWKRITPESDRTVANFLKNRFTAQIALCPALLFKQEEEEAKIWNSIKKSKSNAFEKGGFKKDYWDQKAGDQRFLIFSDGSVFPPAKPTGYTVEEIIEWIKN